MQSDDSVKSILNAVETSVLKALAKLRCLAVDSEAGRIAWNHGREDLAKKIANLLAETGLREGLALEFGRPHCQNPVVFDPRCWVDPPVVELSSRPSL